MDRLVWEFLIEVFGRLEADLLESMLKAHQIDVELFQESIGQFAYPTTIDGLARVQIFVPINKMIEAKELLEDYHNGTMEKSIS
jgi:hypothetical protein